MEKIRVAWICSFSNEKIRAILPLKVNRVRRLIYKMKRRPYKEGYDAAVWNTNAIEEFENRNDVELHVICPVRDLRVRKFRYEEKGIHYYFFREQNSDVASFLLHQLFSKYTSTFKKNRKLIKTFINEIKPEIVHVIGAENPLYSLALLDIPDSMPTIIQLQTLLSRLVDVTKDDNQRVDFYYKGLFEKMLFQKASFIGTDLIEFKDYIIENIKPDAKFLNISLAMGNIINIEPCAKEYDFVYFSGNINKAGKEAVESFVLAFKENPHITLDIIGAYDMDYKVALDAKLNEYGAKNAVTFEGRLPSHNDVIKQIRKAKFALIPLKMDFVPNTIREAMANGLPVVTTITDGTPSLNEKRESVLLSRQGDFQAMADNMISLIKNDELQCKLRRNAVITESENINNTEVIAGYCKAYKACIEYYKDGTQIPQDLVL